MKIVLLLVVSLLTKATWSQKMTITIPSNKTIELSCPENSRFFAVVNNQSNVGLNLKVVDKKTNETLRGFGLGNFATEKILVENTSILSLNNDSENEISLNITYEVAKFSESDKKSISKYIEFTFVNSSLKSIPLIIPNVMNPNLSPNGTSGVSLKIGQEVFFKVKGKKHLLLKVDETNYQNQVIDIPILIKKRKKELNL